LCPPATASATIFGAGLCFHGVALGFRFGCREALRFALLEAMALAQLHAFCDTHPRDSNCGDAIAQTENGGCPGRGFEDEDVAMGFWVEALTCEAIICG
jgi:hypothetical protein